MKKYAIAGALLLVVVFMKRNDLKKVAVMNAVTTYDELFKKYGAAYGVDWKLLKAICYVESTLGLNPRVKRGLEVPSDIEGSKSTDGKSWGLMQLRPETARDFDSTATPEKLNNAEFSIKIGAQFVAWTQNYIKKFVSPANPRFLEFVIKAYNQGVGNTKKEIQKLSAGYAEAYFKKFNGLV